MHDIERGNKMRGTAREAELSSQSLTTSCFAANTCYSTPPPFEIASSQSNIENVIESYHNPLRGKKACFDEEEIDIYNDPKTSVYFCHDKVRTMKGSLMVMIFAAMFFAFFASRLLFSNKAPQVIDTNLRPHHVELPSLTAAPKRLLLEVSPYQERNVSAAQRELASICGKDSSGIGYCKIQGAIDIVAASRIYREFCPAWNIYVGRSFLTINMCLTHFWQYAGVPEIVLTCNDRSSIIYGGLANLPMGTPDVAGGAVTFPAAGKGYLASQNFGTCSQIYRLGMYCPIAEIPCFVFAAWETSTCGRPVQVCG